MSNFSEKSRAGATFLDERVPGWHRRVRLETLDVSSACRCPVAQLMGGYHEGLEQLQISSRLAVHLGFFAGKSSVRKRRSEYRMLTIEWRERITERLREDALKVIARAQAEKMRKRVTATALSVAISILCLIML